MNIRLKPAGFFSAVLIVFVATLLMPTGNPHVYPRWWNSLTLAESPPH